MTQKIFTPDFLRLLPAQFVFSAVFFALMPTLPILLFPIFYLFPRPFPPLFILRAIHGIGFGLFSTAAFTLIINITPEVHRGQSVSYFYVAINVATAIAPAFGI